MSIRIVGIDHLVLRTRDVTGLVRFYCDVLGCTVEKRRDDLGLVHLRAGRSMIDLVDVAGPLGRAGGAAPGNDAKNLDHFALRIESFDGDAIRAQLTAAGLNWSIWTNGSAGTITTFTVPAFSASWNNNGDYLARIGLECPAHLGKRPGAVVRRAGGDAVRRHDEIVAAHVGVLGGKKDATVGEEPGEDQRSGPEVLKQQLEGGRIERRVLRLQHEVIELVRPQQPGHRAAPRRGTQAVGDQSPEI